MLTTLRQERDAVVKQLAQAREKSDVLIGRCAELQGELIVLRSELKAANSRIERLTARLSRDTRYIDALDSDAMPILPAAEQGDDHG
jgi:chromosome segregation ATPase